KAEEGVDQQYVIFPMWSSVSTNPQNNEEDAAFDGKEHDFDAKKPESKVNVSLSSSAQSRKQDDMTKKEAKRKIPIESFTGYRDLNAEFEDCSDNSSNEVNDAGSIVPTVGQNSLNNTNTSSVVGPSNTAVSPTYGKSSFIDASQLPDDPDMPELEDITYSDDEDVVGAEADFNNLESSIPEEPKRVHQALKDPSDERQVSDEFYGGTHILLGSSGKSASTPIDTDKPLLKDPDGEDVDVHTYRSMIGSLMYLTSSRTDIMFECKKQTVVATSSTEAEYLAAASCYAQVLWIQNQLLDYGLVRNVDSTSKFYMYPHFIQLFIKKQLGGLSTHTTRYSSLALTQKVFANMRRVDKGLSGVETPLFEGMLVEQVIKEGGDEKEHVQDVVNSDAAQGADTAAQGDDTAVQRDEALEPTIPSLTPPTPPP
nr:retrotransposon protein, putative, Ty1-copia subclass [Tanacetum cinerariifolium]